MIVLLIALILAASFGGLAYVGSLHPIISFRKAFQVVGCIGVVVSLILGLLFYPSANVWQAYQAGKAEMAKYDAERVRAEHMISLLGSPEAYIEYLKAVKPEG